MPLNIREDQQPGAPSPLGQPKQQPPIRPVTREPRAGNKILLILFFIVVLCSAAFLLYLFSPLNPRNRSLQQNTHQQAAQPPAPPAGQVQPGKSEGPPVTTSPQPSSSPARVTHTKRYTIYIASYADRGPAEEEVGRWNEAGYHAFVVESTGRFRVAIGEYDKIAEARTQAESLSEAFEYGYWIGRIE